MTKKRRCFVIMPFSATKKHTEEYWKKHFQNFLKPLIEQNEELEAYRSEPLRGDILKGIITSLVTVPIVVADLTDYNYNVFWELGVRQSFKHGTITIAEDGTKFPFDLGAKSTLLYDPKDHLKIKEFETKFLKALNDCLQHPERPDSHVLETISGRGSLYAIMNQNMTIRRLNALISELEYNKKTLLRVEKHIKKNVENGLNTVLVDRLSLAAIELLVTNRYLDKGDSFYNLSELYFNRIISMNDQLNIWDQDIERTQKWISGAMEDHKKRLTKFLARIRKIYEEIKKET